MYVRLDDEMRALPEGRWAQFELQLEALLLAHQRQGLILWLSPSDIKRIRDELSLGPMAKATLAIIERRSADYDTMMMIARRRVHLCPDNSVANFEINHNVVRYGIAAFVARHGNHLPAMFVEDLQSDGRAIQAIFELHCAAERRPHSVVSFFPRHGGGAGIGRVIRSLTPGELMGLCVCDRDCHPFAQQPYKPGGTAAGAHDAAVEVHVIDEGEIGYSSRQPTFAFVVTGPRTIEGYIGPELLEVYFGANAGAREVRTEFLDVFRTFPGLSDEEYLFWLATNLKDGSATRGELIESYRAAFPTRTPPSSVWLDALARLSIPRDVLDWIWKNASGGRYQRDLLQGFSRDRRNEMYDQAVSSLSEYVWTMLAADPTIKVA